MLEEQVHKSESMLCHYPSVFSPNGGGGDKLSLNP